MPDKSLRVPSREQDVRMLRRILKEVERGRIKIESLQTGWLAPTLIRPREWMATICLIRTPRPRHRHRRFRAKRVRR